MLLPSDEIPHILSFVLNSSASRSAAPNVADRDRAALLPLTAMVAAARLLVVTRRSGV
jgi:hypothetical protein